MNSLYENMIGCRKLDQRHYIRHIFERDDMEEFIGYVHRRKILDIYVSAIVYYGAWRCMIHVINRGYDLSKNEDLTAYLCNNRELTEEDIRDRERFIVELGGQISLRKKYINKI